MSGIYLHIPFCRQACHYCDFHFSTNLTYKDELVRAMGREIGIRKDYLGADSIQTVYFGGGTPSILALEDIAFLLETIGRHFRLSDDSEITLEANPDDLTREKVAGLKALGINRLSIGIQSFDDDRLKFINRAHTAKEAIACIETARQAGIENITADLIYGIPPEDLSHWEKDLRQMRSFELPHLSVYGLTIEEKTAFGRWARTGKLQEVSEDTSTAQYLMAIDQLTRNGYEHYEVSNFAKPGRISRHNSAYWENKKYLGVGPGAHSYDQLSRSYNISHNVKYIKAIREGGPLPLTTERLSRTQQQNEYVLTHLRTAKGVDLPEFKKRFDKCFDEIDPVFTNTLKEKGMATASPERFQLTELGLMIADEISLRLFHED